MSWVANKPDNVIPGKPGNADEGKWPEFEASAIRRSGAGD